MILLLCIGICYIAVSYMFDLREFPWYMRVAIRIGWLPGCIALMMALQCYSWFGERR